MYKVFNKEQDAPVTEQEYALRMKLLEGTITPKGTRQMSMGSFKKTPTNKPVAFIEEDGELLVKIYNIGVGTQHILLEISSELQQHTTLLNKMVIAFELAKETQQKRLGGVKNDNTVEV